MGTSRETEKGTDQGIQPIYSGAGLPKPHLTPGKLLLIPAVVAIISFYAKANFFTQPA